MKRVSQKGFTFVELLVVVTIIAVLIAAGAVSYQSTNKKARDAKRRSDLEQIRSALEICRAETGSYPNEDIILTGTVSCSGQTYLNPVPTDPRAGQVGFGYDYTYLTATTYSLCATLEDENECPTGAANPCCLSNP